MGKNANPKFIALIIGTAAMYAVIIPIQEAINKSIKPAKIIEGEAKNISNSISDFGTELEKEFRSKKKALVEPITLEPPLRKGFLY